MVRLLQLTSLLPHSLRDAAAMSACSCRLYVFRSVSLHILWCCRRSAARARLPFELLRIPHNFPTSHYHQPHPQIASTYRTLFLTPRPPANHHGRRLVPPQRLRGKGPSRAANADAPTATTADCAGPRGHEGRQEGHRGLQKGPRALQEVARKPHSRCIHLRRPRPNCTRC